MSSFELRDRKDQRAHDLTRGSSGPGKRPRQMLMAGIAFFQGRKNLTLQDRRGRVRPVHLAG
ncbi:hypothetical protein MPNT_40072 [Candidatus Methylacidithermus pantelleriae]|uniref:Uncharacterized protein n=1 Tax=Candidatus Methylacidithermus pantelleriae TaxID=2744239 RepID=A0A8J2BKT2_9BACT|nr:hypothetical protein MPNT_40072 [Candidatus Methylacidithermus pantelleriae]